MDLKEDTEDGDKIHEKVIESIEEEDESKGDSWFNANGQMVLTKVPWPVMMQFIRNYLRSTASSQGPIWPVPNMNRSKRMSFAKRSATILWKMEPCLNTTSAQTGSIKESHVSTFHPSQYIVELNNLI